jgi:putative molybdopterin biosynthesis protein
MKLITLAHRVQGLIFPVGNPKKVTGLDDLAREDIKFINRNRGSGTRIWLDNKLIEMDLDPNQIVGYTQELNSHTAITQSIKTGSADLGIGLIAAAVIDNMDFIPLFEEQYDLVIPDNLFKDKEIFSFLEFLNSGKFRQTIDNLEGYKTQKTGTLMSVKSNSITRDGEFNP